MEQILILKKKKYKRNFNKRELKILNGIDVNVPGDPSSALFPIVAALICKNSDIIVKNVLINPTRDGAFESFKRYGS